MRTKLGICSRQTLQNVINKRNSATIVGVTNPGIMSAVQLAGFRQLGSVGASCTRYGWYRKDVIESQCSTDFFKKLNVVLFYETPFRVDLETVLTFQSKKRWAATLRLTKGYPWNIKMSVGYFTNEKTFLCADTNNWSAASAVLSRAFLFTSLCR